MAAESSRLRQRLAGVARRVQAQVEDLLGERGPLVRGSFGTRARRCGVVGCHCARGGPLHESKYLSATDGGRVRQVHVPRDEEAWVAAGVARYRRFRAGRAQLAALVREQAEAAEALGRSLGAPYPPERPLPPAQRRGRRPQESDDAAR